MTYRALVSFSGVISMAMGEIREITDESIVNDLLKAGYICENVATKKVETKAETKAESKTGAKKGGKKK